MAGASVGRRRSPVHQILTLFGDYWVGVDEPLPTGAVLAALADLGVRAPAARAALVRLGDRGLLEATRSGRRTSHALTRRGEAMIADEGGWLRTFGRDDPDWDGEWSAIFFSIPETERPLRHAARTRLRWLGYAPLYDGVWISPFDTAEAALSALAELGVFDASCQRGPLRIASGDSPTRAWDLAPVRAAYDELLIDLVGVGVGAVGAGVVGVSAAVPSADGSDGEDGAAAAVAVAEPAVPGVRVAEPVVPGVRVAEPAVPGVRVAATDLSPDDAFARRMSLMLAWQTFRQADPGHPLALMPAGWPRPVARTAFAAAYDALGPAAEARMRAHIADITPDLAGRVRSQRLG